MTPGRPFNERTGENREKMWLMAHCKNYTGHMILFKPWNNFKVSATIIHFIDEEMEVERLSVIWSRSHS